jgi:hypothetical protein
VLKILNGKTNDEPVGFLAETKWTDSCLSSSLSFFYVFPSETGCKCGSRPFENEYVAGGSLESSACSRTRFVATTRFPLLRPRPKNVSSDSLLRLSVCFAQIDLDT